MSVSAGKGGVRIGCFSVPFVGTVLVILTLIGLWEINRMRQDLILLKQAYAGTESVSTLIGKAKIHTDNAREELRDRRYTRANEQMTLAGDTLNTIDQNIRQIQKEAQKQYPSILDIIGGAISYVINLVKGLLGGAGS